MQGLVCRLMHSVCQLCRDAVDILKAGAEQNQFPAVSEKGQLQQNRCRQQVHVINVLRCTVNTDDSKHLLHASNTSGDD